jgi:hypothetical protein
MATVTRSVLVRRSLDEVAKVAIDPDVVLPIIGGFGRFDLIARNPDGSEEWDLYLKVGTIHVGGRVLVDPPSQSSLAWSSQRGTHQRGCIEVAAADGGGTVVTMSVTAEFAGALTGWLTGIFADGIVGRHIEAGLQQLRHHVEYGA